MESGIVSVRRNSTFVLYKGVQKSESWEQDVLIQVFHFSTDVSLADDCVVFISM